MRHSDERQRAQHSKLALATFAVLGLVACGGGALPRPERAQVRAADYVAVPYPPRPPQVELVPPRPTKEAVWIDGTWEWGGDRYVWEPGAWVVPPEVPGVAGGRARFARWVIVRRQADGQLFFARSSWQDGAGRTVPPPKPLARARSRTLRERTPSEEQQAPEPASGGDSSGASGASGADSSGAGGDDAQKPAPGAGGTLGERD